MMPSKLSHTSITMWSDELSDPAAAVASMETNGRGGWWVCHFPTAEIDHVWRVLVNAHAQSKAFGPVLHLSASSFRLESHGEVEVMPLPALKHYRHAPAISTR